MGAAVMRHKELTITAIYALIKGYMVVIIVTMKSKVEFVEEEPVALLRVTFCFLALANQSVVHYLTPFGILSRVLLSRQRPGLK
jgi:hypothetical protein